MTFSERLTELKLESDKQLCEAKEISEKLQATVRWPGWSYFLLCASHTSYFKQALCLYANYNYYNGQIHEMLAEENIKFD